MGDWRRPPYFDTIPPPHHGDLSTDLCTGYELVKMSFAPGGDWQSVSGAQQSWGGGGYGGVGFWQSLVYPESQWDYSQLWGYGRQYAVDAAIAAGVAAIMQRGSETEVREVLPRPLGSSESRGERPIVPVDTSVPDRTWEQGLETPLPEWIYEEVPNAPGYIDIASPGWGQVQDDQMATTWTEFAQQQIGSYLGGSFGGGGAQGSFAGGVAPPAQVTVDTRTGRVTPCRRKRRRRLLTQGDIHDLSVLAALVGKGSDAMKIAVAKAVR